MILRRRCERSNPAPHAWAGRTGADDGGHAELVPAARFEELLVLAFATAAAAAPERTPLPSSPRRPVVYYVDVDRFELAATGLTDDAIESALGEMGRRLGAWAGRGGAVTRRGADHFVLLRYEDRQHACVDAEDAVADLRLHLHRPMLVAGRRLRVAAVVGVVHAARAAG
jgi:predicted signal transduction protein with EAL and GGDEF domain